jgi:hypothetical protein
VTTEPPSDRPPAGYGPSPHPHWYGPIPPAPPAGRGRPGRVRIVLTWVLCTVVTATAMAWGFSMIRSAFSAAVPTRTAADGEAVVVDLDPADAPAIYVGIDSPGVGFEISYTHRTGAMSRDTAYSGGRHDVNALRRSSHGDCFTSDSPRAGHSG